ncbi:MAG TPA: hypothetical protein VGB53_02640 [Rubricoccaceae bacterium]|jgi:hypothetical protein
MSIRLTALSVFLLLATGCESTTEDAPDAPAVGAPSAGAPASDAPADSAGAGYEAIQVGPRGLNVMGTEGVSTEVTLGTAEAEALAALTPLLGAPSESGEQNNCEVEEGSLRYVTWADGLTLNLSSDGTVVGWQASGDNERIQTASGVQLGSPLDMARMADSTLAMEPESTLEHEFSLSGETDAEGQGVGGFLSGDGPNATVRELYSGMNCYMR